MKPMTMFLAYAGWMVVLAFLLWVNKDGNILVSVLASLFVLNVIRVRTQ